MGSLPHNLYKIKFRQIKGLVRTANTYVVLPIYLTSSSTLRLLLRSSHLSLMVSTVISIFYMRTPRHAQRNRVIRPRSQSQSHDSNPGCLASASLLLTTILYCPFHVNAQDILNFFNIEPCLYYLWIGKDFFLGRILCLS